ncbi:hypothetical protein C1645_284856 [Glomus cerebriforme]|uniref:Uncharacterized protein n=1 Tax=Glomus cerebriforme TaxID=658196 RepID=A0A397SXB1_9GLOM|nr:hypothetical protein C1645_284856 [Glomus cerebriforme]
MAASNNPNPNLKNSQLNNLEAAYNKLKDDFEELKERFDKQINLSNKKDNEIRELERKNDELKDEASKYQSALGSAINLQLSNSDENNPVSLKKDMLKLQDSLEDYITTCKGDIEINIIEIQKLLKKYESNSVVSKDQKPLIKAVLQRHVIERIFMYGEEYFEFNNLINYKKYGCGTETYLYNKACELIKLAEVFAEKRDGVDDTTKVFPIKLRQQIYAALGNRGFNNVITDKKQKYSHDSINYYKKLLNKEIDKYRTFKDSERKREIEEKAGGIIQNVISLFWFRLEVQEPIAEYIWFKYDDKIDPSYMEGTWEDDEIDNIVVDICYFPLIAQEFDDKSKCQIYTKAIILHKSKQT